MKTTRRSFLQTGTAAAAFGANFGLPLLDSSLLWASSNSPILRLEADPKLPLIRTLSWDTEGGDRAQTNLLRSPGVGLRVHPEELWLEATDLKTTVQMRNNGAHYALQMERYGTLHWDISSDRDGFTMTVSAQGVKIPPMGGTQIVFRFDPWITPTNVLPSVWHDDGDFELPLVLTAPDFGQMLLRVTPGGRIKGRLRGNLQPIHILDVVLEMPPLNDGDQYTFTFTPLILPPPAGFHDESMWRLARRGWFNSFQPTAAMGDPHSVHHNNSVPGILGTKDIGGPASLALYFYSDPVVWTPVVAEGVSVAYLVRKAVDYFLAEWTHSNGAIAGYSDYVGFLDSNPSILISAWAYVQGTDDRAWLGKNIKELELVANYCALRDEDGDGLPEAIPSGNAGTLVHPARSSNWFDAVNYGYKDAYSIALIYRAWRCMADLEAKLHREPQRLRYTQLANKLKAAYAPTLYNPKTGFIACWKSLDGQFHDYVSPIINSMAISYGLVEPDMGKQILNRLWAKMQTAGFHRFDLGVPSMLEPVHRSDYLQPNSAGDPTREDGTDTFQYYMNGGIAAGFTLHFMVANYMLGYDDKADGVLRAMLERQQKGLFQNGVQNSGFGHGMDFVTWGGKPAGYEGYMADVYYFLQTVVLRDPQLRKRVYDPLFVG